MLRVSEDSGRAKIGERAKMGKRGALAPIFARPESSLEGHTYHFARAGMLATLVRIHIKYCYVMVNSVMASLSGQTRRDEQHF